MARAVVAVFAVALALLAPLALALVPPQTVTVDPCGATLRRDAVEPVRPEEEPSLFRDDAEDATAWSLDPGALILPFSGETGCYVRVAPLCCGQYHDAVRGIGLDSDVPLSLRFAVRLSPTVGSSDFGVEFMDADGRSVLLTVSEPSAENNGLRFRSGDGVTTFGDTGTFGVLERGAWHEVELQVDPIAGRGRAIVRDADGALLHLSPVIPTGEGNLASLWLVRLRGIAYSGTETPQWGDVDTFVIRRGPSLAPPTGDTIFAEPFDSLAAWTLLGPGSSTDCDVTGCYLRMTPACCGTFRDVGQSVTLLPGGRYAVDVRFRAVPEFGMTDAMLEMFGTGGRSILLSATESASGFNDGFRLRAGDGTNTFGDTGGFASWTANEWYDLSILVDPAADRASLSVSQDGTLLAASVDIPIGDGDRFGQITSFRFRAVSYGDDETYHWDELRVIDVA